MHDIEDKNNNNNKTSGTRTCVHTHTHTHTNPLKLDNISALTCLFSYNLLLVQVSLHTSYMAMLSKDILKSV